MSGINIPITVTGADTAATQLGKVSTSLGGVGTSTDKANDALKNIGKTIKDIPGGFDAIGNNVKPLAQSLGGLVTETKAFPEGEAVVRLEAPRGELFYYAKGNKTQVLERLKINAPTFSNVAGMVEAFTGNEYGSAAAIIASYDPCLSCTAR